MLILKIATTIALLVFGFYLFFHDGKTISEKNLSKKEREYLDILQIISMIAIFYPLYCIWN